MNLPDMDNLLAAEMEYRRVMVAARNDYDRAEMEYQHDMAAMYDKRTQAWNEYRTITTAAKAAYRRIIEAHA